MISIRIDPVKYPAYGKRIPNTTAQEKGETIRYMRKNGMQVPYIQHFEKPEVEWVRNFYKYHINKALKDLKLKTPHYKGPVYCEIHFYYGTANKKLAKDQALKVTKSDLDNLVKLLIDAMADMGFFETGDQQICQLIATKQWNKDPLIEIKIGEIGGIISE